MLVLKVDMIMFRLNFYSLSHLSSPHNRLEGIFPLHIITRISECNVNIINFLFIMFTIPFKKIMNLETCVSHITKIYFRSKLYFMTVLHLSTIIIKKNRWGVQFFNSVQSNGNILNSYVLFHV